MALPLYFSCKSHAVSFPIIRPLLTYDKDEIIKEARRLDTFDISKGPEMCCILGPKHPATAAKSEKVELEEKKLNIDAIVNDLLSKIEIFQIVQ